MNAHFSFFFPFDTSSRKSSTLASLALALPYQITEHSSNTYPVRPCSTQSLV
jgi:hypothetical protein